MVWYYHVDEGNSADDVSLCTVGMYETLPVYLRPQASCNSDTSKDRPLAQRMPGPYHFINGSLQIEWTREAALWSVQVGYH